MDNPLLSYGRNVTSEHGEDGVIERIFSVIGDGSRLPAAPGAAQALWCVELGALNGVHGSNVWHLIKEKGWSGVLIEADRTYFEKLEREYAGSKNVHSVNAFVSFEGEQSLDRLLAKTPMPHSFDLFSLDVDGAEYHLWDSMNAYRPRLMVVEFNPSIPNDVSFVQPRDMGVFQGSSLRAFVELAKRKGYELIAANETNAFFVEKDLFPKFGIADNSIDALHTDTRFETKLFQLYDGTLKIAGQKELIWHRLPIDEEKLQVLPRARRVYPARISPSNATRSLKYLARRLPFYRWVQKIRKSLHS